MGFQILKWLDKPIPEKYFKRHWKHFFIGVSFAIAMICALLQRIGQK